MPIIKRRLALIEQFGSACQRCGYNKSKRALHFHHIEAADKYNWAIGGGRASVNEIEQHPERFMMVCANCHAELHDEMDQAKFLFATCQYCGKQFRTQKHRAGMGRAKYCSKKCTYAGWDVKARTDEALLKRIWKYVKQTEMCWEWQGGFHNGKFASLLAKQSNGKYTMRYIHRVLFEKYNGVALGKRQLIRTCDNPKCVRPDHYKLTN